MRAQSEEFQPPGWLRNSHLQSMLASMTVRRGPVVRRAAPVVAAERQMLLDCGDGVRLQCFRSTPPGCSGTPAVLLHGWEGSAESLYVLSLAQQLFESGFDVVRLNLRDHGATHHLNRELFHSCRLPEVIGAMRSLQGLFPGKLMYLVGFSLGGNFLLRVATDTAGDPSLRIGKVIAVSPVLDPGATLIALERGIPGYQLYFIRKWMSSLLKKQAAWPADYDFGHFGKFTNLRRMTADLIRHFTEYPTLDDYLNGYSITGDRLAGLDVPASIITSLDDPIIPAHSIEGLAHPPSLQLVVTRWGGHCGFLERLTGPTWIERRIVAELQEAVAEGGR
ncbi:MAG TPA: alpha/beta fold hydrolase [Steroidobacteraceae bacterium]|nr:alpha/beta fold hydrolase [Steroidobacteraceae bacterium]